MICATSLEYSSFKVTVKVFMSCRDYEQTLEKADGDKSNVEKETPEPANGFEEAPKSGTDIQASLLQCHRRLAGIDFISAPMLRT